MDLERRELFKKFSAIAGLGLFGSLVGEKAFAQLESTTAAKQIILKTSEYFFPPVIKDCAIDWKPYPVDEAKPEGPYYVGYQRHIFHYDPNVGDLALLVKIKKGACIAEHGHPKGEFAILLKGHLNLSENGHDDFRAGDIMYAPPGSSHKGWAVKNSVILAYLPQAYIVPPSQEYPMCGHELTKKNPWRI